MTSKEIPMNKKRQFTFLLMIMFVVLQACNLPNSAPQEPDLALTVTAQALLLQSGTPALNTDTPAPQFTATITLTPTPGVPTVTVSQNTNCRTGPGTQYGIVGALLIGETAEVVGKNSSVPNYWVIKTPNGSGTCWLWGEYATVSGNTANLPEITVPPTPTPTATPTLAPPAPVSDLAAAKICIPLVNPNYQYGGTLTWKDQSNNEAGFNIYYNGGLFGTVGANVTSYPIPPIVFPAGVPMTLDVEAYNDAGKSAKKQVIVICP
jgi:hypothetical protein